MTPDLSTIAQVAPTAVALAEIGEDLGAPPRWKHLLTVLAGLLVAAILTADPTHHLQEILLDGLIGGLAGAGLLNLGAIVRGPAPPPRTS